MSCQLFHASPNRFDKIDLSCTESIGFHVGSLPQALVRLGQKVGYDFMKYLCCYLYIIELDLDKLNCIEIRDIFEDDGLELFKHEILRHPKIKDLCHIYCSLDYNIRYSKSPEEIANILVDSGIQFIRYKNEIEFRGYSYCILDDRIPIYRMTIDEALEGVHINHD